MANRAHRKLSIDSQLCVLDGRYANTRRASVAYLNAVELPDPVVNSAGMKTRWKRAFFNLKRNGTLKHKESMERIPQEYVGSGSDTKMKNSSGQKSVSTTPPFFLKIIS